MQRDAIKRIFIANYAGSIDRGVTQYAALSTVAASKSSILGRQQSRDGSATETLRKPQIHTNWVHNQIHKIINGSKETNVRYFLSSLLFRLKEIESKGALIFGSDHIEQDSSKAPV